MTYTGAPGTAGQRTEQIEIIGLLLHAGADRGIRNKSGKIAIDYARDVAGQFANQCKRIAGQLPSSTATDILVELPDFVLARDK